MTPYVPERQVEYWTNVQIQLALQSLGCEVSVFPVTGRLERVLGVDAVFACDFVKLFGLQYKVLHPDGGDHWNLTPDHQRAALRRSDWAYYCCSDMRSMRQAATALHLARFYNPRTGTFPAHRLDLGERLMYARWGGFLAQLAQCRAGVAVTSPKDLSDRLGESREAAEIVDAIVVVGFRRDGAGTMLPAAAAVADRTLREFPPDEEERLDR